MTCRVVVGAIEMLGPYQVMKGTSRGEAEAITTTTRSLYRNGSTIAGDRTDNRTLSLVVKITGRDLAETVEAYDALQDQVDQQTFDVVFDRGEWGTTRYQCMRSPRGLVETQLDQATDTVRRFTVEIPASPFPTSGAELSPSAYAPDLSTVVEDFEASYYGANPSTGATVDAVFTGLQMLNQAGNHTFDAPVVRYGQPPLAGAEDLELTAGDVTVLSGGAVAFEQHRQFHGNADGSLWYATYAAAKSTAVVTPSSGAPTVVVAGPTMPLPTGAARPTAITSAWNAYSKGEPQASQPFVNESVNGRPLRGQLRALTVPLKLQACTEFFNGATSMGVHPGVPNVYGPKSPRTPTVWAVGVVPVGATHWRRVLRWLNPATGLTLRLTEATGLPSSAGDVQGYSNPRYTPQPAKVGDGAAFAGRFLSRRGTTPVDTSADEWAQLYLRGLFPGRWEPSAGGIQLAVDLASLATFGLRGVTTVVGLTLWDAQGRWARYHLGRAGRLVRDAWAGIGALLGAPVETGTVGSATGTLNRAAVTGWDVVVSPAEVEAIAPQLWDRVQDNPTLDTAVDHLSTGLRPGSPISSRGVVHELAISGSAPTDLSVHLSRSTPFTDAVVAAVPRGLTPLLVVDEVTTVAPGFDGVAGGNVNRASSAATALPTGTYDLTATIPAGQTITATARMVVRQYDPNAAGGPVVVAQRVLTGVVQPGGRYVRFGPAIPFPLREVPPENTTPTYTFDLTPVPDSAAAAIWGEVIVSDVRYPLMGCYTMQTPRTHLYLDAPVPPAETGRVFVGNLADRSDALAPAIPPIPTTFLEAQADSILLMLYSTSGIPDLVAASYWERNKTEMWTRPGDEAT